MKRNIPYYYVQVASLALAACFFSSPIYAERITYYITPDYAEVWEDGVRVEIIHHYRINGQKVATRDKDGLKYHYSDHLGSASRLADTEGNEIKALWYTPFGVDAFKTGDVKVPYKYNDKEHDDTGMYYYIARYHDAQVGRFMSADTILPNVHDPRQLNRYAYVGNNPLIYTDPSGHVQKKVEAARSIGQSLIHVFKTGFSKPSLNNLWKTLDKEFINGSPGNREAWNRSADGTVKTFSKVSDHVVAYFTAAPGGPNPYMSAAESEGYLEELLYDAEAYLYEAPLIIIKPTSLELVPEASPKKPYWDDSSKTYGELVRGINDSLPDNLQGGFATLPNGKRVPLNEFDPSLLAYESDHKKQNFEEQQPLGGSSDWDWIFGAGATDVPTPPSNKNYNRDPVH